MSLNHSGDRFRTEAMEDVKQTVLELMSSSDSPLAYQQLLDLMRKVSRATFCMLSLYEPGQDDVHTVAISGEPEVIAVANELLGFNLTGKRWPHDPYRDSRMHESMLAEFSSLEDFAGQTISPTLAQALTQDFQIGRVIIVNLRTQRHACGDITLFMPEGQELEHRDLVELVAQTVGFLVERGQTEEQLRSKASQLEAVFQQAGVGVCLLSIDGRYLQVNEKFCEMTGYTEEELMHLRCRDISSPAGVLRDATLGSKALLQRLLQTGEPYTRKKHYIHKSGRLVPAEVSTSLLRDPTGAPMGLIRVSQDITERQAAEDKLRQMQGDLVAAKEKAERANLVKSRFVADLSHEIRNPINGIMGFLQLLERSELSEGQQQYLQFIRSSTETLLSTVNNVLDIAKVEAGKSRVDTRPFSLHDVVEDALSPFIPEARSRGLYINSLIEHNVVDAVVGDRGKLRQILINLIGNAVKFTDKGGVLLTVTATSVHASRQQINFVVSDTGIGIPSAALEQLFEPFNQVDNPEQREGSGLGLSISKALAELLGGEIDVESSLGKGSAFTLKLPLTMAESSSSSTETLTGLKFILLTDDSPSTHVLRQYLRAAGSRVDLASSPQEVIDLINSSFYHALLVDREDVTSALHEMHTIGIPLPVGVGAWVSDKYQLQVPDASEIVFMAKPYRQKELLAQVACFGRPDPGARYGKMPPALGEKLPRHSGPRVLVAEDDFTSGEVLKGLLATMGLSCDIVRSGKEAVDAFVKNPFHLVFMDCRLPELSGYAATKRIRTLGTAGEEAVIVAVTASVLTGDRERCLRCGMNDFLAKPVDHKSLSQVIEKYYQGSFLPASVAVGGEET